MKNWFITGASRGLGRAFAEAALERGDHVAVTSRNIASLKSLVDRFGKAALPLALDMNNKYEITAAFAAAVHEFGHVDVVVNNAGYILLGALEEMSEVEVREQLETLFFGPVFLTQEAVRHMRESGGGGTVVQVSSLAGIGGLPGNSMYAASKWALEGMCEAVRQEVKQFGIRIIILEPASIRTDIGSGIKRSRPLPAYAGVMKEQRARWATGLDPHADGDPQKCAQVLLDLVEHPDPPARLVLGAFAADVAKMIWSERIKEVEAWDELSRSVCFTKRHW